MAEVKKWSHTSTPPYVIMAWTGSTLLYFHTLKIHTRMMMIEVVVIIALLPPPPTE